MATMGGQTLSKDPGLNGERCFMHCVAELGGVRFHLEGLARWIDGRPAGFRDNN